MGSRSRHVQPLKHTQQSKRKKFLSYIFIIEWIKLGEEEDNEIKTREGKIWSSRETEENKKNNFLCSLASFFSCVSKRNAKRESK